MLLLMVTCVPFVVRDPLKLASPPTPKDPRDEMLFVASIFAAYNVDPVAITFVVENLPPMLIPPTVLRSPNCKVLPIVDKENPTLQLTVSVFNTAFPGN
jgi:hypothetical protein